MEESASVDGGPVGGGPAGGAFIGRAPVGRASADSAQLQEQVRINSAAAARQYVRSFVRERWGSPSGRVGETAVIDLLLVVSELVTNAIRHGGGIAGFQVTPTSEGVRLGVRDYNDIIPAAAYGPGALPPPHVGQGFGWPLIMRLAREIVINRHPAGGKTITVLVPMP